MTKCNIYGRCGSPEPLCACHFQGTASQQPESSEDASRARTPSLRASHETIYAAIHAVPRGGLRRSRYRPGWTLPVPNRPCVASVMCSIASRRKSDGPRLAIGAGKWRRIDARPTRPERKSTLPIRAVPGSAGSTRTPTACCGSICPGTAN